MLYIRTLLSMMVSLYTSRIVLNTLGVEDFGIYNVVSGIIVMFAFINGAMANGSMRFITFELGRKDFNKLNKVFSASLTIHFVLAGLVFLVSEILGVWFLNNKMNIPGERLFAANLVLQFTILSAIMSMTQIPYTALIMAHEKMKVYAYIGILEVVLRIIVVILLVKVAYDKLILFAFLTAICSLVIALLYRYYCLTKFKESKYYFVRDYGIYKELTSFAGWNLIGSMAHAGTRQGVNILLNLSNGPIVNAAFGIANQVSVAINGLVQNFMTAIKPQIVKSYANGDYAYFYSLIIRSSKFTFYLLLYFCLPVLLETEYILSVWLVNYPVYSIEFTRLFLIFSLIYVFIDTLFLANQASGKIKNFQIFLGALFLLNLPTIYFLLKFFNQPTLALWLLIFSNFLSIPIALLITRKTIPLFSIKSFAYNSLLSCLLIFSISFFPLSFLVNFIESGFFRLAFTILISTIVITTSIYIFGLDSSEKKYLKYLVNGFLGKFNLK